MSVVSEVGAILPVVRNQRPLEAADPAWTALPRGVRPGADSFASFRPSGAEEPLAEGLRIIFTLRRRFQPDPNVEIVSVVRTSIARSPF